MEQDFQVLNKFRDFFFQEAKNKGWHKTEETDKTHNIPKYVANLHSEVSEFWEAYRAGKINELCDKAEKMKEICGEGLTCAEEELADVCIRLFDSAGALNIDLAKAVSIKHQYNRTRSFRHGNKIA